jgi:hypothetical protein
MLTDESARAAVDAPPTCGGLAPGPGCGGRHSAAAQLERPHASHQP